MNIASCQCVCPKAARHRNVARRPLRGCQCELAGRWNLAARRTNPRRVRKVIQVQVQSRACFQASDLGLACLQGSIKAPAAERSPAGTTRRIPDSPSVLSKHRSPSVLLTHLTRDGRPTGSTWPPWPRPMGAPGVAGVGGPGRMTTGGNRAAGARARLHHLRPARSRLRGSRLSDVRPRPPLDTSLRARPDLAPESAAQRGSAARLALHRRGL